MRTLDELRTLASSVDGHNMNSIATAAEVRMLIEEIDRLIRDVDEAVEMLGALALKANRGRMNETHRTGESDYCNCAVSRVAKPVKSGDYRVYETLCRNCGKELI